MRYDVLALGSNGSGQLGLGHCDDVHIPTKVTVPIDANGLPVKVVAGGNHTLLQYDNGTIFVAGENVDGRCGVETQSKRLPAFTRLYLKPEISTSTDHVTFKLCCATWEASIIVTLDDKVYTCGSGTKGELGHGPNVTKVKIPTVVPDFPPPGTRITQLASCLNHIIAVLSNGDVYGWGHGRKGQLGEPAETVWKPRRIEGICFKVAHVVCGRDFSCMLSASSEGQCTVLGGDKWSTRTSAPSSIVGWREVNATWSSILVLNKDGNLSGWGRNDHHQLPSETFPLLESFITGSEHAVARTISGEIIAWGWGEHGNCGSSVKEDGYVNGTYNRLSHDPNSTVIGAGCATTWISRSYKF